MKVGKPLFVTANGLASGKYASQIYHQVRVEDLMGMNPFQY